MIIWSVVSVINNFKKKRVKSNFQKQNYKEPWKNGDRVKNYAVDFSRLNCFFQTIMKRSNTFMLPVPEAWVCHVEANDFADFKR